MITEIKGATNNCKGCIASLSPKGTSKCLALFKEHNVDSCIGIIFVEDPKFDSIESTCLGVRDLMLKEADYLEKRLSDNYLIERLRHYAGLLDVK